MATAAQIAANRRNAQLSTGPRTPEGKRASSGNALTFGLFANNIRERLSEDDRQAYDDFIDHHTQSFSPKGPQEEWLARKVAEAMFHLDRAHELTLHVLCEPFNVEGSHRIGYASSEPLPNLALYQNRWRSNYQYFVDRLEQKQRQRKVSEQVDRLVCDVISEAAAIVGVPFQPSQIGFDFSKRDLVKNYLRAKLVRNAEDLVLEETVTEETKFRFTERLRQATRVYSEA